MVYSRSNDMQPSHSLVSLRVTNTESWIWAHDQYEVVSGCLHGCTVKGVRTLSILDWGPLHDSAVKGSNTWSNHDVGHYIAEK